MTYLTIHPNFIKDRSGFRSIEEIDQIFFALKPCERFTYEQSMMNCYTKRSFIAVVCRKTFRYLGYIV